MSKKSKTYYITAIASMAAIICCFAPLSIPIGPIPVSLTNLVLYISVIVIGYQATTVSYIVYMLIGIIGLPVFSGLQGGIGKVAGPTGGYLIGFIPMVIISGLFYNIGKSKLNIVMTIIGMILGTAVAYLLGTLWFVKQMDCDWAYALSVCVFPFIPFDLGKIAIANVLGRAVRNPLVKAGYVDAK